LPLANIVFFERNFCHGKPRSTAQGTEETETTETSEKAEFVHIELSGLNARKPQPGRRQRLAFIPT